MNDKIARIIANTKCPSCGSKVKRDVHVPRHGCGKNKIVWRCLNVECEESKYWHGKQ